MDDIVFTFDTAPFLNGIDKISKGFKSLKSGISGFVKFFNNKTSNIASNTKKQVDQVNKVMVSNFGGGAKDLLNAFTKRIMALGAAFLSIRAAMKHIPEIGRTFSIAGDIMARNFLYPLRKLLIPQLQKLLDWTRDHRIMFVKWGVHLANAFRVVLNVVKGLIKLVKTFVSSFVQRFEEIFGKTVKRMSDVVNIIMFKITAVISFILIMVKPLMKALGKLFGNLAISAKGFWEGLVEGTKGISKPIGDAIKQFSKLLNILGGSKSYAQSLYNIWKSIGVLVGTTLKVAFMGLAQVLDSVAHKIENLSLAWRMWKVMRSGEKGSMEKWLLLKQKLTESQKSYEQRSKDRATEMHETVFGSDKKEKVVPLIPKSSDGKKQDLQSKVESHIKIGDMNINISSADDARKVGREFGMGINETLVDQLRKNVLDSMEGVAS